MTTKLSEGWVQHTASPRRLCSRRCFLPFYSPVMKSMIPKRLGIWVGRAVSSGGSALRCGRLTGQGNQRSKSSTLEAK